MSYCNIWQSIEFYMKIDDIDTRMQDCLGRWMSNRLKTLSLLL